MKQKTKEAIEWVMNNIDKIPEKFIEDYDLDDDNRGDVVDKEEVVWLLNREDGTAGDYETSKERLGVRKDKQIVWGFTSGCSCWNGWGLEDYNNKSYKEFILLNIIEYKREEDNWKIKSGSNISLSENWEDEIIKKVEEIRRGEGMK